ncbi:keratin, type I cytoskeletal 10-like protein, partial [Tanacetum coccineum]
RPHMTWKEKKAMENRKVVSLGGKAPKKQRLPLSVARVMMKKQKERDQKTLQENMILGQVGGNRGNRSKRAPESRKPEDRVLMSTAGRFRNGVLDVKDMLKSSRDRGSSSRNGFGGGSFNDGLGGGSSSRGSGKGGGKKGGKKKGGKKGGRPKGH